VADEIGKDFVRRNHPCSRVDEKDHEIGLFDGRRGLLPHTRRKSFVTRLESGCIYQRHIARADCRFGFAPVAGQPRLVVDESEPLAGKPVEQGGLADIRPSNDGNSERHLSLGERSPN